MIALYDSLTDEISKTVLREYVRNAIYNCVYSKTENATRYKYFECYKHIENEVFLNLGSNVGDTIFSFVEKYKSDFDKIYAVEGEDFAFWKLERNI